MIVVLFLSNSFYLHSQVTFSKEEVEKIANLIFDKEYCDSINVSLYRDNKILSDERKSSYKGLIIAKEMIIVKDSINYIYKNTLKQCDSSNNVLIDKNNKLKSENKTLKTISLIEGLGIVILTLILL